MKYLKLSLLIALAMVVCARLSYTSISGTAHDLSGETYTNEICNVCHTPHNAIAATDAPLWNHTLTTATFTLYTSSTLDATIGQPNSVSKLCLSCHDGSVAIDSFGGAAGSTNISGDALLGTDLTNDHPISFTYNATLAGLDGELQDPTAAGSGFGGSGTIEGTMLFGGGASGTLTMECATCHDVHDNTNSPFLRLANTGSAMCLTCHLK